jgi:hypothetical protein
LCVPYAPKGFAPANLIALVDRALYPIEQYPAGQWDYQLFYEENFDKASATFEANPLNTIKALFRKGDPAGRGKPGRLATVRRDGGWFGGAAQAPDVPMDRDILTDEDLHRYASALVCNGFFGPDAWYVNGTPRCGVRMPRLERRQAVDASAFFHAAYDYTRDTVVTIAESNARSVR